MIGLINHITSEYVFLGQDGEHFFIYHNDFSYGDGSGLGNCESMVKYLDGEYDDCLDGTETPSELLESLLNHVKILCGKE